MGRRRGDSRQDRVVPCCPSQPPTGAGPYNNKTDIDVDDLWDHGVGYNLTFSDSEGNNQFADLTLDGEPAGYVTFALEQHGDGPAGVVLVQAETPEPFRRFGHAQRLVTAIRDRFPDAVLVDGPSENTPEGEQLLATLRRHNTIHTYDCFRTGAQCICNG